MAQSLSFPVPRPLVTIICLCYNHDRFVLEALDSVVSQTYPHIQLLVVDDASTDTSKKLIENFVREHPGTTFISHESNLGNCKAFNSAFAQAQGEFIIDFSADDVLLPERVDRGVQEFAKRDDNFGVQFGDAWNIDEANNTLGLHSDAHPHASIPEGDVYADLIRRFFVCGTSMMVRKKVLDQMGGYDESLQYEDFDLWIRSSREFMYFYLPVPLVKRRIVKGGLNEKQFTGGKDSHAWSTLAVCRKVLTLNRTRREQLALQTRLKYEIRQSLLRGDIQLAVQYALLWKQNRSQLAKAVGNNSAR